VRSASYGVKAGGPAGSSPGQGMRVSSCLRDLAIIDRARLRWLQRGIETIAVVSRNLQHFWTDSLVALSVATGIYAERPW